MIRKIKAGWRVYSKKGRNMGTYKKKKDARKRLKQIERFGKPRK